MRDEEAQQTDFSTTISRTSLDWMGIKMKEHKFCILLDN